MTTATGPAYQQPPARLEVKPVSMGRVFTSEWIKIRSLRSTVWTLLVAVVVVIGLGLIIPASQESQSTVSRDFDPVLSSLGGTFLAQLAIGVLGVLIISGEYATGSSRSTFAAVPKRLPVLWAKAFVYTAVTFVVMAIAAFIAFFGGQAALSGKNRNVSISDPGVLRAVFGSPIYLVLIGLLGLALGTMIRSSAGSIAALFGVIFVLPIIFQLLPGDLSRDVRPYLPGNAGQSLFQLRPDGDSLSPWAGFGMMALYVAVLLGLAAFLLKRRDV